MRTSRTMRFGGTAKLLLKSKLKYYRISECSRSPPDALVSRSLMMFSASVSTNKAIITKALSI